MLNMLNTPAKVNRKMQRPGPLPRRRRYPIPMARRIIQIYEVQTAHEAEALAAMGVDHIGSVVLSATDWKLPGLREAIAAARAAGARSSLIPLFGDLEPIRRTLDYYRPDIVHFCDALPLGNDAQPYCEQLIERQIRVKEEFPDTAIMRSIPIAPPGAADRVPTLEYGRWFQPATDFFLTDTLMIGTSGAAASDQPVSGFVGITGKTCDWNMARRLVQNSWIPVILAGGISPGNVSDAMTETRPAGIDSCTLTNACDAGGRPIRFRKDIGKVKHLVDAVRRSEEFFQ
jgi:phosphoribosylanthranilate isomerase